MNIAERNAIIEYVREWVNENTYSQDDFSDIGDLVDLKRGKNVRISVGIPTLNEGKTIGNIVGIIRKYLQKKYPLVDEIHVIDSGSYDNTKTEAINAGAKFSLAEEHSKKGGIHRGKGENLWISLYVMEGDIISWVDADIENFDPKFVYGPVGAILKGIDPVKGNPNKGKHYVKSFYERPLKRTGERLQPHGGGRVTEISFRQDINVYFPELLGFVQPLSGEYAGTRQVLERIPFSVGYGVEAGHLIDIVMDPEYGLDSMGQVDLNQRVHRNQDLNSLRNMSYGIKQLILKRAMKHGRIPERPQDIPTEMYIPINSLGKIRMERHDLEEKETVPINETPDYKKRHHYK